MALSWYCAWRHFTPADDVDCQDATDLESLQQPCGWEFAKEVRDVEALVVMLSVASPKTHGGLILTWSLAIGIAGLQGECLPSVQKAELVSDF
jgi:hypothetical protein